MTRHTRHRNYAYAEAVVNSPTLSAAQKIDILGVHVEAGPYFLDGAKGAMVGGIIGAFAKGIGLTSGLVAGSLVGLSLHWMRAKREQERA